MSNLRALITRSSLALALSAPQLSSMLAPSTAHAQRGARKPATDAAPAAPLLTAEALQGVQFRSIGPSLVTGRIADIKIDPKNPSTWYIATAFGGRGAQAQRVPMGVYKATLNRLAGTTLTPVGPSQSFSVLELLQ